MRSFTVLLFGLLWMAPDAPKRINNRIVDPYKAEYFSCEGRADGRLFNNAHEKFGYNGFRIVADLNFDGREDVILSKSDRNNGMGCGNGGCDATIFLKQSDNSYVIADFGLHPDASAAKMVKRGEGELAIYWHASANEGSLSIYKITSDSIKAVSTKTLHCNESAQDKALYESWFSGNLALKPEFARCKNGQLKWSDFYQ